MCSIDENFEPADYENPVAGEEEDDAPFADMDETE
jgi:hypothetical protein